MDRDSDMNHVKSASDLREALAIWNGNDSSFPRGIFGDTVNGKSFSEDESALLERLSKFRRSVGAGWRQVWNNLTNWTLIDTRETTERDIAEYEEAMASDRA